MKLSKFEDLFEKTINDLALEGLPQKYIDKMKSMKGKTKKEIQDCLKTLKTEQEGELEDPEKPKTISGLPVDDSGDDVVITDPDDEPAAVKVGEGADDPDEPDDPEKNKNKAPAAPVDDSGDDVDTEPGKTVLPKSNAEVAEQKEQEEQDEQDEQGSMTEEDDEDMDKDEDEDEDE